MISTLPPTSEPKSSHFLRQIIEKDLLQGTYAQRHFSGSPGGLRHHQAGPLDPARIRTRFPPEPNGYLHIGHVKSICLNFGLARDFDGVCHLRFDDTNPEKEDQAYVDAIIDAVQWLGFDWWSQFNGRPIEHLYFASNYFGFMAQAAEALIEAGLAYVDEQSADEMRLSRGDFNTPGSASPWRARTPAESLSRFEQMKAGELADGFAVLRAKIDMAHPNINLRDPVIYRIRKATHHNTGDAWCIYPMYTFAHPIEDALEGVTHSICTLEFEDQRPFYDWLLEHLCALGLLQSPPPKQYEFARLNLSFVVTSKRKLRSLVDERHVDGWDDPRLPTIAGLRRRGYTPESLRLFAERIGVSKADSWIDYGTLEIALRDDLDPKAARACVVLDPLRLRLVNFDAMFGGRQEEACQAAVHPAHADRGYRHFALTREIWIEREDFMEDPPKGFFRLSPPRTGAGGELIAGTKVRLKYGFVIECLGTERDGLGQLTVLAALIPDTKSGTPGADSVKVKGVLTWVSVAQGVEAEVRLFDRLFLEPQPDAGGRDYLSVLNSNSRRVVRAFVEPGLAQAQAEEHFQFERHGYFVADRFDHGPGRLVFNRTTTLKDSWGKSA